MRGSRRTTLGGALAFAGATVVLTLVWSRRRRKKVRFGRERVVVPFAQDLYGLGDHVTKRGTTIRIRLAKSSDAGTLLRLIQGLAQYENEPLSAIRNTEASLLKDGFGASPKFYALLALDNDVAVGIALFYDSYSTWQGPCTYLEDLFVEESHRKHGLGSLLLKSVAAVAFARGHHRLHWNALDWNTPAIQFYTQKCGADLLSEWLTLRMPRASIATFLGIE